MVSVVSETYWNISGYAIFWLFFAIAFGLFVQRAILLFRLLHLGQQDKRSESIGHRIRTMIVEVIPQWCSLRSVTRKDIAGVGHAFLFWCFSFFLIGYIIFIGLAGGFGLSTLLSGSTFETVYSSILDIAGIFVILAIVWAAIRRYIVRPERLEASAEAGIILILIFSLMVLHFCIEGFGYASHGITVSLPPIGGALADFLIKTDISKNTLDMVYKSVWWLHYFIILGFMVYVLHSKHLHILAAIPNVFFKSLGPKGALKPANLAEEAGTFGTDKIQDFTWKQLLDLYACTECGRCHAVCPATASDKFLSPREVIINLKKHLLKVGPELLKAGGNEQALPANFAKKMIGDVVTPQEIWECTTCGACQEVCPPNIEHIDKIMDIRRNLVLESASIPEVAEKALISIEDIGHPWRGTTFSREDWAEGLGIKVLADDSDIDILFWVGCTEALEDRSIKIAQAVAKILKLAEVKFGILGFEEGCCGEPARRLGNEYLFQIQARKNIELLERYNVRNIITACPHCYNTIKNEYPQFGGNFKIVHHTEFISSLLNEGKIGITKESDGVVTYHDPCYLGRHNNIYELPRQILSNIPGITMVEMENNKQRSFCCGGGGGHMWLERGVGQQINEMRLEQAIDAKAKTIVTACPWCVEMLEDGMGAIKEPLRVMDIAELVAGQL